MSISKDTGGGKTRREILKLAGVFGAGVVAEKLGLPKAAAHEATKVAPEGVKEVTKMILGVPEYWNPTAIVTVPNPDDIALLPYEGFADSRGYEFSAEDGRNADIFIDRVRIGDMEGLRISLGPKFFMNIPFSYIELLTTYSITESEDRSSQNWSGSHQVRLTASEVINTLQRDSELGRNPRLSFYVMDSGKDNVPPNASNAVFNDGTRVEWRDKKKIESHKFGGARITLVNAKAEIRSNNGQLELRNQTTRMRRFELNLERSRRTPAPKPAFEEPESKPDDPLPPARPPGRII